ncbi:GNAT family N-acetyltransferase [Streptacidiphilus sp. ASG 303]|uniref:GNAT family N-acetyltransferase n=1 Tax=Streptacidiphilus sp. ASG 303 TaxID=2896847 RepID=UPI001E4A4BC6|nr:GNAT family N-acetyltransferase [Streptacidiphilus sp. ASG 303]MCD0482861.1 GNAT family N-acetyltransferase [Streptacidiphilus sp. ASG 303]
MDIVVRTARPEDLEQAGRITADAFVGDGHTSADGDYVRLLRDARTRAAEAELLVAADPAAGGAVVGCVTFALPGGPWADIAREDEGEIRMLAVARAARGRGAGEALVRASMERARAHGLSRMAFSTQQGMHAAHRLYERLGFRRAPERDWSPVPGVDLWVYAAGL